MYGKRAPVMPFSGGEPTVQRLYNKEYSGMYGKRSGPFSSGKRASPLPMFSGGMYGKRASLGEYRPPTAINTNISVFDEAKRPVMPFSGGESCYLSGIHEEIFQECTVSGPD